MKFKNDVFVIMPFSGTECCSEEKWNEIYEHIFIPAIENSGYKCERALPSTGSLIESIIYKLKESSIVLADITDKNPNVFYELGVRHSLSNRTIIVAQDPKYIPSDLKGYWAIIYGTGPKDVDKFKNDIKRIITEIESNPDKEDNPVSKFIKSENIIISKYKQKEDVKKLNSLLTEFSGNRIILQEYLFGGIENTSVIVLNSLELLLKTYYIDIGSESLKIAYNLYYTLMKIKSDYPEKEILTILAIEQIDKLVYAIIALKEKLIMGEYEEPIYTSLMVWENSLFKMGEIDPFKMTCQIRESYIPKFENKLYYKSLLKILKKKYNTTLFKDNFDVYIKTIKKLDNSNFELFINFLVELNKIDELNKIKNSLKNKTKLRILEKVLIDK